MSDLSTLEAKPTKPTKPTGKKRSRKTLVASIGLAIIVVLLCFAVAVLCIKKGTEPWPSDQSPNVPSSQDTGQVRVAEKVTSGEAADMAAKATTVLQGLVARQQDPVLRRDTLLINFCSNWSYWATLNVIDEPTAGPEHQVVTTPFMPFHDAAAQLYGQVALQFKQDYGLTKDLPSFDTAYQAQCLVY